ncbi:hypothetical protein OPV22_021675 [Ensete ventricosum]|uniref:Uncharacterized protein n=1 Tax=Ensete ventricosum TaxID=4639 RepID=A0AAV8QLR3_ENSVE|nr:hypothetical protein OPV22_021675 [Ensete ventricosum]
MASEQRGSGRQQQQRLRNKMAAVGWNIDGNGAWKQDPKQPEGVLTALDKARTEDGSVGSVSRGRMATWKREGR